MESRKRSSTSALSGSEFSDTEDDDDQEDDVPLAVLGGKTISDSIPSPAKKRRTHESSSVSHVPLSASSSMKSPFGLRYYVPDAVRRAVIANKPVSLFKLLPGYDSSSNSHIVTKTDSKGNARLSVTSQSAAERKLGKQQLEIGQMILALQKYKAIISDISPDRASQIDCYLSNIIHIYNTFPGNAYWGYHQLFWENASDHAREGIAIDWRSLDSVSLQAAIAHSPSPSSCGKCSNFSHTTATCPFTTKEIAGEETSQKKPFKTETGTGESFKTFCTFFNHNICRNKACNRGHRCFTCGDKGHGMKDCNETPCLDIYKDY